MKGGGLMVLLGGGKPKGGGSAKAGPERQYASEAFAALKDDDEAGFIEAFVSAVRACVKKEDADEVEPDADDAGGDDDEGGYAAEE